MICDCHGFPLDARSIEAVARKFKCAGSELTIIHSKALAKNAEALIRANLISMAIEDGSRHQDWWSAVLS